MELSGLIFVALAVAWAAYLIPKALQHHDEVTRSRSVDRFSDRMRILAHREPVDGRNARLVVPGRVAAAPVAATTTPRSTLPAIIPKTPSTARAARRRRRVLGLLLLANAVVIGVVVALQVSPYYVAIPAGLLVAWLVACRLMVRSEHRYARVRAATHAPDSADAAMPTDADPGLDDTTSTPAVADAAIDPELWDPLPVTLPTYVSKPAARRTVRTIDFDDTGAWSSGRSDADSAVAREADEAERAARARRRDDDGRRAVGS